MIQVTTRASQHLVQMRNAKGLSRSSGVRFVPKGEGVGMTFSSQPEPGDSVLSTDDITIYIAADAAPRLDGSTIDVATDDGKASLVLRRSAPAKTPAS